MHVPMAILYCPIQSIKVAVVCACDAGIVIDESLHSCHMTFFGGQMKWCVLQLVLGIDVCFQHHQQLNHSGVTIKGSTVHRSPKHSIPKVYRRRSLVNSQGMNSMGSSVSHIVILVPRLTLRFPAFCKKGLGTRLLYYVHTHCKADLPGSSVCTHFCETFSNFHIAMGAGQMERRVAIFICALHHVRTKAFKFGHNTVMNADKTIISCSIFINS